MRVNWNKERFSSILEEESFHLAHPDLDSCPDCGNMLVDRQGDKVCSSCGTRQPVITQRMAQGPLIPLELGAMEAMAPEAGGAAAGGAGGGMNAGMMGKIMQKAMSGGAQPQQSQTPIEPGAPGALGDPGSGMSIAPVGVLGAFGESEVGRAVKDRGDDVDPDQGSSSGSGFLRDMGDGPEQQKDVASEGAAGKSTDQASGLAEQHGGDASEIDSAEGLSSAQNAFHANLPLVLEYAFSDKSGEEHPLLKALDDMLEQAMPGYRSDTTETPVDAHDPKNPTEELESEVGQDLDDDGRVNGNDPEKQNVGDFAREAALDPQDPEVQQIVQGAAHEIVERYDMLKLEESPDRLLKVFDQIWLEILEDSFDRSFDPESTPADYDTYESLVWPEVFKLNPEIEQLFRGHRTAAGPLGMGIAAPGAMQSGPQQGVSTGMPVGMGQATAPCPTCGKIHDPNQPCPTQDMITHPGAQPGPPQGVSQQVVTKYQRVVVGAFFDEPAFGGPSHDEQDAFRNEHSTPPAGQPYPDCPACKQGLSWDGVTPHVEGCPDGQQRPTGPAIRQGLDAPTMWGEHNAAHPDLSQDLDPTGRHSEEGHDQRHEDGEAADGGFYEDWSPDQDQATHPWVDEKGEPLAEGQEYDLHSSDYAVPDRITVESVTPRKLTFTLHSGDVDYRDEITVDDVGNMGYTFQTPSGTDSESGFGMEDLAPQHEKLNLEHPVRPGQDPTPQTDDLSVPPSKTGALRFGAAEPRFKEGDRVRHRDDTTGFAVVQAVKVTPNGVKYDLYDPQARENIPDVWDNEDLVPAGETPSTEPPSFYGDGRPVFDRIPPPGDFDHTASAVANYDGSFAGDDPDLRSHIFDPPKLGNGHGIEVDPLVMAKLAGRNFSPREQREFIEEAGEARNLHRLDLEGSHYEDDENFLFGV